MSSAASCSVLLASFTNTGVAGYPWRPARDTLRAAESRHNTVVVNDGDLARLNGRERLLREQLIITRERAP